MQYSPDFVPMKPGEPGSSYNNPIDLTHQDDTRCYSPRSLHTPPPSLTRQNTSTDGLYDPPIPIGVAPNAPIRRQSTNGFNYSFDDEEPFHGIPLLRREQPRDYGMDDPLFESEVLMWFSAMPLATATQVLHRITRVMSSNASHNMRGSLAPRASSSSSSQHTRLGAPNPGPLNLRTPVTPPPRKRGHQDISFTPEKEGFAPHYDEAMDLDDDNTNNATMDVDDYSNEPGDSSDDDDI